MDNLALRGQLSPVAGFLKRTIKILCNERGEIEIPFIETISEEQRPAVESFITNVGATPEELGNYKSFDEFLSGYKPKAPQAPQFSWKTSLSPDMQKSPTLAKFDDSPEGLSKAVESHLNLEKLLGHEKVPLPKGADDKEGWARFKKAMGIPDKADGYALEDAKIPDSMKGMTFDKKAFAEIVHKNNLTPEQAKGLWSAYTQMSLQTYQRAMEAHQNKLTEVVNSLRQEWGDAYDANVDLGQTVINKFASDKEENDFLTASLTKDPRFIKFLAKIGNQFAENKIGEFSVKRFAKSPAEAQREIDAIISDPTHPYLNEKADPEAHQRAVEYVNQLYLVLSRASGQA